MIECAGWIVVALFVLAGVRVLRAPSAAAAAAPTWVRARPVKGWAAWFGAAVAVEFALIALGQHLLAVTLGHAEWTAVWVLLVVGFHFWPLAMILRLPAFRTLAGLLCGVALAAALCAALSGIRPLWSILPGVGGAAVLWGFSARALYGMYGGRWPSTPAAFSRSRTHGDGRTGR